MSLDSSLASLAATYAIERELGGGGMSRVYLARDIALGRSVVLKLLDPELTAGMSAERFRREIHVAAGLQHPHIVPLLAAGEADGILFFTMPFIDGDSLRARLAQGGSLPLDEAVRLAREVASALAYAHRRGLVHRDIKPDNVLLSDGHALVTDFGIAKAIASAAGAGDRPEPGARGAGDESAKDRLPGGGVASSAPRAPTMLTSVGTAIGTPAYMAPEQGVGDPSSDHRADLYSLGIVLYEMLAGGTPFGQRTTPHQYLMAHMVEPPAPITTRRADVPPALAALLDRLLAKSPEERPASADDVVRALDDVLRGGTGPTSVPAGAATPGLARGTTNVGPLMTDPAITGAPATAAAPATRSRAVPALAAGGLLLALAGMAFVFLRPERAPSGGAAAVAAASAPTVATDRVIVMPFANETGDASLEPVGRMAADWLTRGLAETGLVKLIDPRLAPRDAADGGSAPRTDGADPAGALATARAAGAGTLVTGRYYKLADSLYFELRMVDARSGEITGTLAPVSGPATSPTAALDRLNRSALGALAARFNPALADFARQSNRPPSYEAYKALVAGQQAIPRRDFAGALAHYEEASRLDSGFVAARMGILEALENLGRYERADTLLGQLEARRATLSPLEQAQLDEYATSIRGDITGNLAAAFRMHALAPGGQYRATLATKLMNANRLREALDTLDAANAEVGIFEKSTWVPTIRMRILHHLGEHERALVAARTLRQRFPADPTVIGEEVTALAALGRADELRAMEAELRSIPNIGSMRNLRRTIALEMQGHGHEAKARALLTEILAAYDSMPADSAAMRGAKLGRAVTLSALGRHDEAYAIAKPALTDTSIGSAVQLSSLAAWTGDREAAMRADARMAAQPTKYRKGIWQLYRARTFAALGDRARAVALLREAQQQGYPVHLGWHGSAELRTLKGDPGFEELIRPRR